MAVDPKTVGGGAAIVALGGGAGYGISKAVSEKEGTSDNSQVDSTKDTKALPSPLKDLKGNLGVGTIGKAISDSGFDILTEETKYESDWNEIITANTTTGQDAPQKASLQTSCKTLLETKTEGDTSQTKQKEAIKKCVNIPTFKSRLKDQLKIALMEDEESPAWNTKRTNANDFKTNVLDKSSVTVDSNTSHDAAKKYCELEGEKKWNTISSGKNFEEEWKAYVKTCAKESNKENTDYWTAKPAS